MIREKIDKSNWSKIEKISPEAKAIYDKLYPNIKEMYRMETCPMCGEHLTVRQLNRVILQEIPPICFKCYKRMGTEIEKCKTLLAQKPLF